MFQLMQKIYVTICFFILLVGCATQAPQQTLYEQLGGEAGVNGIITAFIKQIGKDKQVFHYFKDASISRFRSQFTQHLCVITDGACAYKGDSMTDVHTGMHITEKDFNHVVDLLINAMNAQKISHRTQNKLLARLAPLRANIIYI